MTRIHCLALFGAATFIFGCSGADDRTSSTQQSTARCNPGCPAGMVCRAGTNGAPNDCVAANNNNNNNKQSFGGQCTMSGDCESGVCVQPPNAAAWCSQECQGRGQANCPNGYECEQAAENVFVCLAAQPQNTPNGKALGETCAQGQDCASGLCLGDGQNSGYCTQECGNAACPQGYQCAMIEQYRVCEKQGGGNNNNNGTMNCSQLWDCIGGCNDATCEQQCIDRATQSAYDKLSVVAACFQRSGCNDQTTCEQACGNEIQACLSD